MEPPAGARFPASWPLPFNALPAIPPHPVTSVAGESTKRRGALDDDSNTATKVATFASDAMAITTPQQRGPIANLFFIHVPSRCDEIACRIGFPLQRVFDHRDMVHEIQRNMPNGEISLEKMRELSIMMLGQSLNLASTTIRTFLGREDLLQTCESLQSRLFTLTLEDLNIQYDEVHEHWVPGPLLADMLNLCSTIEVALLQKLGMQWQSRFGL
jgi:hypothetical protein